MAPLRTFLLALSWFSAVFLGEGLALCAAEPPNLAGTWTWTWKDPQGATHRHVMEVEGVAAKLAARERSDALPPVRVSDLKLDGKNVGFTIVRGPRRADYRGVVADPDTINGKVSVALEGQTTEYVWKAKRGKAPEDKNEPE
jgi:hypothetical protein